MTYHVDSSFDHKVTSSVIVILKIEVSLRQPLGTPIFKPWKGPNLRKTTPCYQKAGYGPESRRLTPYASKWQFLVDKSFTASREMRWPVVLGQNDVYAGAGLTDLTTMRRVKSTHEISVRTSGVDHTRRSNFKLITWHSRISYLLTYLQTLQLSIAV